MRSQWTIPPWSGVRRVLSRRARRLPQRVLGRRTLVVAPHPDDEVLGCGGVIARMRHVGTPVRVVFLTDGEDSHSGFVSASELKSIRRGEARAAARVLDVPPDSLTFLEFPDGSLREHEDQVAAKVAAVLGRHEPEQVFLPSRLEPTRDHRAAHRAVRRALEAVGWVVGVYEYPIWAWAHWPWIGLPIGSRTDLLRHTLTAACGLRVLFDFRWQAPIDDLLDTKRAALACHRSQMRRPGGREEWPILADVARGSFLQSFFQESEFFGGRGGASSA